MQQDLRRWRASAPARKNDCAPYHSDIWVLPRARASTRSPTQENPICLLPLSLGNHESRLMLMRCMFPLKTRTEWRCSPHLPSHVYPWLCTWRHLRLQRHPVVFALP